MKITCRSEEFVPNCTHLLIFIAREDTKRQYLTIEGEISNGETPRLFQRVEDLHRAELVILINLRFSESRILKNRWEW